MRFHNTGFIHLLDPIRYSELKKSAGKVNKLSWIVPFFRLIFFFFWGGDFGDFILVWIQSIYTGTLLLCGGGVRFSSSLLLNQESPHGDRLCGRQARLPLSYATTHMSHATQQMSYNTPKMSYATFLMTNATPLMMNDLRHTPYELSQ